MHYSILFIGILFFIANFAGCVVQSPPVSQDLGDAQGLPTQATKKEKSEGILAWASEEKSFLLVDKSCGTVDLYRHGRLFKTYSAVFGRQPGSKVHEGDQRTPTGLYMIVDKISHPRWSRFLRLDYPNLQDRLRYQKDLAGGNIPKWTNGYPGVGGDIGIHGSDKENFNQAKINWTLGCVSLVNKDVQELDNLVSAGTLVYIKD